jgi:hypothetical protein
MADTHTTQIDMGALQQRVYSNEAGITDLRNSMAALGQRFDQALASFSTKLDERSKTPWGNIIAACGVTGALLGGLVAMVATPIVANLIETKSVMRENRLEATQLVRDTAIAFDKTISVMRERLDRDIRDMRQDQVPRKEHEKDWLAQTRADEDFRRRVDEIRTDLSGLYSAKDVIRRLESQVEQLQTDVQRKN